MNYRVTNLMTGEMWEGIAQSAKEAYKHITINKNDTTLLNYGKDFRLTSVKEWNQ